MINFRSLKILSLAVIGITALVCTKQDSHDYVGFVVRKAHHQYSEFQHSGAAIHLMAVGPATVWHKKDSLAALGTATLIEPNVLVSAAHVFRDLLPRENLPDTGPVYVNLQGKEVYWHFDAGDLYGSIPLKGLVFDVRFLHNCPSPKSDILPQEAQKYDLVFLEIDTSQLPHPLPFVPLITDGSSFSRVGVSYGYGLMPEQEQPIRQHIAYDLNDWNLNNDMGVLHLQHNSLDYLHRYQQNNYDIQVLTGNEVDNCSYARCVPALPGDSGGPLFVLTPDGVRLAGVMSVQGTSADRISFNGFCLVINRQNTYDLLALLHRRMS